MRDQIESCTLSKEHAQRVLSEFSSGRPYQNGFEFIEALAALGALQRVLERVWEFGRRLLFGDSQVTRGAFSEG